MDMRITSVYNAYSVQAAGNTKPNSKTERSGTAGSDKIQISAQASDYQAARNAIAATPDIRENIVSNIKEMLNAGTYSISPADIAASIFQGA